MAFADPGTPRGGDSAPVSLLRKQWVADQKDHANLVKEYTTIINDGKRAEGMVEISRRDLQQIADAIEVLTAAAPTPVLHEGR